MSAGLQDPTPTHSQGFGAAESADETRQAQQTQANDVPTDVNCNAVLARTQATIMTLVQGGFAANQDRRDKVADDRYMTHKPATAS